MILTLSLHQQGWIQAATRKLSAAPQKRLEIDRFLLDLTETLQDAPVTGGAQHLTDWLQRACEMIDDPQYFAQGAKGFTLLANRSKEHVARELKKCLGKTPTEIVNQARMRYAADKLCHSSIPIIDIAMDCGFESLSHFYKIFRVAYGITPRQYREVPGPPSPSRERELTRPGVLLPVEYQRNARKDQNEARKLSPSPDITVCRYLNSKEEKTMKRRTLLTLVLAVLCIFCLTTSSFAAPKKTKDFVIGFANGYFGNNWRAQFIDDAVAVADKWKARGIVKEFTVQNVNDDVTKQIVQLNSLIDQGVDCLIINPVSAESLAGVVRRAKQMGVLIVNADDPAAYDGTYSVCGDHRAFIGIQAKWLSEQLKTPSKVVHVHGLDGNSCDKVRMDETRGILAKNPNVSIIAEAPGGWNETKAQDIMSNWLSAYPKIDAVMTQDIQAEGIMRAYDIAGKPYPVMTGDYNMGFFRKWAANPKFQSIGVTYNPGIGGDAVEVAIRLLMGWKFKAGVLEPNQVNPKLINTVTVSPAFVITKEAAPNGPWLKGYKLGDFTKKISLAQAIKLGEGKPDAYLLDGTLEDSVVDALFDKPAGWTQSWD